MEGAVGSFESTSIFSPVTCILFPLGDHAIWRFSEALDLASQFANLLVALVPLKICLDVCGNAAPWVLLNLESFQERKLMLEIF